MAERFIRVKRGNNVLFESHINADEAARVVGADDEITVVLEAAEPKAKRARKVAAKKPVAKARPAAKRTATKKK